MHTYGTQTVVFEHNRPYLKTDRGTCKKLYQIHYKHFDSNRFDYIDTFNFIDENEQRTNIKKMTNCIECEWKNKTEL